MYNQCAVVDERTSAATAPCAGFVTSAVSLLVTASVLLPCLGSHPVVCGNDRLAFILGLLGSVSCTSISSASPLIFTAAEFVLRAGLGIVPVKLHRIVGW